MFVLKIPANLTWGGAAYTLLALLASPFPRPRRRIAPNISGTSARSRRASPAPCPGAAPSRTAPRDPKTRRPRPVGFDLSFGFSGQAAQPKARATPADLWECGWELQRSGVVRRDLTKSGIPRCDAVSRETCNYWDTNQNQTTLGNPGHVLSESISAEEPHPKYYFRIKKRHAQLCVPFPSTGP